MSNLEPVLGGDDTVRRNFSKIEDLYTALEAALTRLAALEADVGSNRIIRGTVSSAGAVVVGSGWSAARNAAGDYTVTFTSAFAAVPSVVVSAGKDGPPSAKIKNAVPVTAAAFSVFTLSFAGAAVDGEFHFIAIGPT